MNIQFKKGVLELCVLSLLVKSDRYGYELANSLTDSISISDGTVYPILRKLRKDGLVTTYLQESSGGPPRKYYKLTKGGIDEQSALKGEWSDFVVKVSTLINEGEDDE